MQQAETQSPLKRIYIEDIAAYNGQAVTLKGWLYNKRSSGKLHFLELRDGTGIVQCVMFVKDVSPELFARADKLPQETSLVITGMVKKDDRPPEKRAPLGFEI